MSDISKVATFTRGLNQMQPALVSLLASSFAMRRFGYANEAVSTFVALCGNAMNLSFTYSIVFTSFVITLVKYSAKPYFNFIVSGMSMLGVCFTVFVNFLLLRTYAFADDLDNVTRYYWLMVLANFAAGTDATCIATLAAGVLSPYAFGLSMAGIAFAGYHIIASKLLHRDGVNIDYWHVLLQFAGISLLSIIATVFWIAYLIKDKIIDPSDDDHHHGDDHGKSSIGYLRALPMAIASAVAWGGAWAIFPYVSPFETVQFEYHSIIQILCIVFDAMAGFILLLVDNVGKFLQKDWYSSPYAWWHTLWLLFIPFFGIGTLFVYCMHHPESGLAKSVLMNPMIVGPLTVFHFFLGRLICGFSLPAIKANAKGHGEVISPLTVGVDFVFLNMMKYMSEAYVQQFKLAKEGLKAGKAWPTAGMSARSAVLFWIRVSAAGGYANFREMSTADVKQRLGGVARRLVSYHRGSPAA